MVRKLTHVVVLSVTVVLVAADDPPCTAEDFAGLAAMDYGNASDCALGYRVTTLSVFPACLGPDTGANVTTTCTSALQAGWISTYGINCGSHCSNPPDTSECLTCLVAVMAKVVASVAPLAPIGACVDNDITTIAGLSANDTAICGAGTTIAGSDGCVMDTLGLEGDCGTCMSDFLVGSQTVCAPRCEDLALTNRTCAYCNAFAFASAMATCNSELLTTTTTSGVGSEELVLLATVVLAVVAIIA